MATIILSGGGTAPHRDALPSAEFVIAADSGLHLAEELGMTVDLIVGDFDSADPAIVEQAMAAGADVESHPADKDATDLDLAMSAALERGATHVAVAGGGAGRLDHLLGAALLIASPRWAGIDVEWHTAHAIAYPIHRSRSIPATAGDLISLIPVSPEATVSIGGTRWTLEQQPLELGSTRGISNVATGSVVTTTLHRGAVLLVRTPA